MAGEWRVLPFSHAVLLNPGVHLERGTAYPFVDMAAVNSSTRSVQSISHREYSGGGSRFRNGDTLMARITPCLENGKIARFDPLTSESMTAAHGSTEFIVLRGRPNVTDTDFVYYLTKWPEVRNYAIGQMTGTSGRQRVPTDCFDHLTIAIPPLPKQHAIAHILGTLDDKIELNRRMNETLEAMARSLFKDWFVDFGPTRAKIEGRDPYLAPEIWDLFPDKLDEDGKPEGWEDSKVEDYLELAYGKSLPAKSRRPGGVAVYGSGGLTGFHDEALIKGPAIIVGRKGTVGSLYWEDRPIFPIDTVFYVVPKRASLSFCYQLLLSQPLAHMNTDAAVPGLNRNNAYRLNFPWPGSRLTNTFESFASPLWKKRTANFREIDTLSQSRDLLLPKLISGEIRVGDADKFVQEST